MEQAVTFNTRYHNYPYACFRCRKSFKRPTTSGPDRTERLLDIVRPCPDCAQPTHYMGKDFKALRRSDRKGWTEVEAFILSGNLYYHGSQMESGGRNFHYERDQMAERKRNGFVTPSQGALTRRYWAEYQKRKISR